MLNGKQFLPVIGGIGDISQILDDLLPDEFLVHPWDECITEGVTYLVFLGDAGVPSAYRDESLEN